MSLRDKVLVVEDDEPTAQAVSFKLEKEGFEVVQAGDGVRGLEMLKSRGPIAVVLLDLRMPGGDGFKFLEEKTKVLELANVPVIVFSNLSQRGDIDRALAFGVNGYLVKAHHSVQEIVTELRKCLREGKCTIDY